MNAVMHLKADVCCLEMQLWNSSDNRLFVQGHMTFLMHISVSNLQIYLSRS